MSRSIPSNEGGAAGLSGTSEWTRNGTRGGGGRRNSQMGHNKSVPNDAVVFEVRSHVSRRHS